MNPRSRTISRPSPPVTGIPTTSPGSRLVIPPLKPSPSLSNLHIHSHNTVAPQDEPDYSTLLPLLREGALGSSASSIINVDLNEGILIQDTDTDTDIAEEDSAEAFQPVTTTSDESKRFLREQLRKTLSGRQVQKESESSTSRYKQHEVSLQELPFISETRFLPREYFVLTDAGKPVFVSRPGNPDPGNMASTIGIMQALISVFIDDADKIRCINAGQSRITFLLRPPLYYVCISSWGEPESVSRAHLEYLHLQIISIVTASQLRRIFERRTNFDLRRLLGGAESFLTSLIDVLELDIAISSSSLNCLKLDPSLRKKIAEALVPKVPSGKTKELLYIILVVGDRVVTLIRPRKHSIHPADIHILLNTIKSPSIMNSQASASWIPVCLPKFYPSGFVNAYISFLPRDTSQGNSSPPSPSTTSTPPGENEMDEVQESNISLICVSSTGDFEHVKNWCETATKKLSVDGLLRALTKAVLSRQCVYTVAEVGVPGLRHFVYKSRSQVQITLPTFEDPYNGMNEKRRLITLYQTLHDSIHAKSGQSQLLKLQYIRTDTESVMGWVRNL